MNHRLLLLPALFLASIAAADVRLVEESGHFKLLRDGKPYLVRGGGGGEHSMETLAAAGGNSIRLWGDEKLGEQLDAAQELGLTITAGIWLGQVRQGFDWTDADGLAKQREHIRATVLKYKDHPALLMWALGNEMEDPQGKNGAVWTAINSLAVMVKQLDPHHPTMTVIAEIGGEKVKNFHRLCPEIDILGINSYGGVTSVAERYKKLGGTKPFILTEYGPAGIWEVNKDPVTGAYPELTSTAKAEIYRTAYKSTVLAQPDFCLGSYAFLWGHKQEATATWFGMYLEDGARLGAVDAVSELWTGKPPANRCPTIQSLTINCTADALPGSMGLAILDAADPEKDPLKVTWLLQRDAEEFGSGGDKEAAPPTFPEAITQADLKGATIKLPAEGGLYRLFAIVHDNHGGGAVANVPIRIKGDASIAKGRRAALPIVVYAEEGDAPYIPSGFMGDHKSIHLDPASTAKPHGGKTCLRCEFTASAGWGGVLWQSPANDWGDKGGGFDLTGAKKLTFWARGEKGGEVVTFLFGGIGKEKRFFDTGKGALEKVTLTSDWKPYEIAVAGQDLTRIKSGFGWSLASPGAPVVFYLDDIRWE